MNDALPRAERKSKRRNLSRWRHARFARLAWKLHNGLATERQCARIRQLVNSQ